MKLEKVLCIVLLLTLSVSGTLNAAEKSAPKKSVEDAEITLGKSTVDRFEQMFQTGQFDFNPYGRFKITVLHYAVLLEDLERVKQTIEKGADVNAEDSSKEKPLIIAADYNNWEIVKLLVENGADVNAQNEDGNTAVFFAALNGNLEMVQYLVEKGADITTKNKTNSTILNYAARSGNLKLVQWLVNQGISVSKSNGALHHAVSSGNLELVKWLVAHGADVHGDYYNDSVLLYAVRCSNKDILRYLVEEKGVDVNESTNRKMDYSALEEAVKNNNIETVKYLVEHGARINSYQGYFFLLFEYHQGAIHPEIVQYLRDHDPVIKGITITLSLIVLAAISAFIYMIYRMIRPKKRAETELSNS